MKVNNGKSLTSTLYINERVKGEDVKFPRSGNPKSDGIRNGERMRRVKTHVEKI
jgi:hypothetical protein